MKIGVFPGTFDLLHAGHILALREAKNHCGFLIVLLQTDPSIDRKDKNKPIQSVAERMIQLNACKYVDEIYTYDTEESLNRLLIKLAGFATIRFLGEDWKGKEFTGQNIHGLENIFLSRKHNYSSSELRKRLAKDN